MFLICFVIFTSLLTCTESATYKERCGTPGTPEDGKYNIIDNNTIKYHCKDEKDFRLVGNETRICGLDGTWDRPIPWCEPNLFYKTKTDGTTFTGEGHQIWGYLYEKKGGQPQLAANVNITLSGRTAIKELMFTVEGITQEKFQQLPITVMNGTEGPKVNCTYKTHTVKPAGKPQYLITYECSNTIADTISINPTINGDVVHFGIYGNSSVVNDTCGEPDIPANGNISSRTNQTVSYTCNQGFSLVGNETITCRGRQWSGRAPTCTNLTESSDSTSNPTITNPTNGDSPEGQCNRVSLIFRPICRWELIAVCVVLGIVFLILLVVLIKRRKRDSTSDKDALTPDSPSSSQAPLYENIIRIQPNSEQVYATLDFRPNDSSLEPREERTYADPTSVGLRGSSQTGSETLYSSIRNPYDVYASVDKSKKKRKAEPKIEAIYSKINKKKSVTNQSTVPSQPIYAQVNKKKMSVYEIREEIEKLYETVDEAQTKKRNQGPEM